MRFPLYPRYRSSGVEWLSEVPEHWDVDRVRWSVDGCFNGTWGEEPNGFDDVTCIRVADFDRDNFRVKDARTHRAIDPVQLKTRRLKRDDLLIEKSGGGEKQLVGCVVSFDDEVPAVCSNFVARMPIANGMCARFWCYVHAALYGGRLNYPVIKQTTGIQNLDADAYLNTRVAYPSLAEQRTIAAFLDGETLRLDRLIAKKWELIERLKEKRTALISRAITRGLPSEAPRVDDVPANPTLAPSGLDWLGYFPAHWRLKRIGDEFEFVSYGFTNPMSTTDEGPPMVTANDINRGHVLLDTARRTSPEDFEKLTRKSKPRPRDVLVTKDGTLGRIAVVESDVPFCINQSVALLRPKPSTNERFIAQTLQSPPYFNRMLFEAGGTTIKHIYITRLARLPFAAPPITEQAAIATYVDAEMAKLDELVKQIEIAIERLQEYRTALITAAVTGKIDVRKAAA